MAKTKQDGGAAFPHPLQDFEIGGVTVREYFAGQALIGELASGGWDNTSNPEKPLAEWCYKLADAMIAERDRDASD